MKKRSNRNLRKSRTGAGGWPTMWLLAALAWGSQFRSSEPAEKTCLAWQCMFVTKYRGAGHRRIPGGGWPSRLPASGLVRDSISKIMSCFNPSSWEGEASLIWIASSSVSRVIQWYLISGKQNIVKSERMTLDIDTMSWHKHSLHRHKPHTRMKRRKLNLLKRHKGTLWK